MGGRQAWKFCVAGVMAYTLLSASWPDLANAERRAAVEPIQSTYRISAITTRGIATITGHGTAFGIDLSDFGDNRNRYVMTACHVIRDHCGNLATTLKIEIKNGRTINWMRCRLVACDVKMDVALLETEGELRNIAAFSARDAGRGTAIVTVGSPAGVPLRVFKGTVTETRPTGTSVARVEFIKEGCSGGPVFEVATRRVVGLVVAGVGKGGKSDEMDPHTCLYVSRSRLIGFLRNAMKSRGRSGSSGYATRRNSNQSPQVAYEPPPRPTRTCSGVLVDRSGMWLP